MFRFCTVAIAVGHSVPAMSLMDMDMDMEFDGGLSLLQMRAQKANGEDVRIGDLKSMETGAGCDNCADGYVCSGGSFGAGRAIAVSRDAGCGGALDLWDCTLNSAKAACGATDACLAFGISDVWGLNRYQLFGSVDSKPNAGWNLWAADDSAVCTNPDVAAAVGDPHLMTNSGKQFDLKIMQTGAGCDNCADGYVCSGGSFGAGRAIAVSRDAGCGGAPDLWDCTLNSAKAACGATDACLAFGISDVWGLNRYQLFGSVDSKPNAGWNLWAADDSAVCTNPDVAAAVGDPHLMTNSGKQFDLKIMQTGAGCDNCADGYVCSGGSFGAGRAIAVSRDAGCGGAPDLWDCTLNSAKAACGATNACLAFGISDVWGLNKYQLFGSIDSKPNAGWNLWAADDMAVCNDAAAAVGDPHLTTNSGKQFDLDTPH